MVVIIWAFDTLHFSCYSWKVYRQKLSWFLGRIVCDTVRFIASSQITEYTAKLPNIFAFIVKLNTSQISVTVKHLLLPFFKFQIVIAKLLFLLLKTSKHFLYETDRFLIITSLSSFVGYQIPDTRLPWSYSFPKFSYHKRGGGLF